MLRYLAARRAKNRPAVPDGVRVYAIGDVHGRADLLEEVFANVDADLKDRPVPKAVHVMLGDYIDRGPNSRGVFDLIIERMRNHDLVALKGNHETFLSLFLREPGILRDWRPLGGFETLMSYGLRPSRNPDPLEQRALADELNAIIPASHRRLLGSLPMSFTCGSFFFVHAGVRPGVPLTEQREDDLLWIRDDFLLHEDDFGKIVVHGHTPVKEPEIRPNRINIDTGAYATGMLTCLILEGQDIATI